MNLVKIIPQNRGGYRSDPNRAKAIRLSIHKDSTGKRVKLYIGSEVMKKYGWLNGDNFFIYRTPDNVKVVIIERTFPNAKDSFKVYPAGGASNNHISSYECSFKYEPPFPYVESITSMKIIKEENQRIYCELP